MIAAQRARAVGAVALLTTLIGGAASAGAAPATMPAGEPSFTSTSGRRAVTTTDADRCDFLDEKRCLLPFPSDFFTVADSSTDTGKRVNFAAASMPTNSQGVHVDPTEWNRNDGFSPGTPIMAYVSGIDLRRSGAAPVTDIGHSLAKDAPIVVLDEKTKRRVAYWTEMGDAKAPSDRVVVIHPAVALAEGHQFVVALRRLRDGHGRTIAPTAPFRAYRDRSRTDNRSIESRRTHMEKIFTTLAKSGVKRDDLFLAWDFTVASERSLSERVLHMRDDALGSLGTGNAPGFTVTNVETDPEDHIARRVSGTFDAPSYLTDDGGPGTRLDLGANGLPQRSGVTLQVPFLCVIPHSVLAPDGSVHQARAAVYGHGLLGSVDELNAPNIRAMTDEHDFVYCGTNWMGLSEADVPTVVTTLTDLSKFPTIPDRAQQAFVNFQLLARLMKSSKGFVTNSAFTGSGGKPVFKTGEVFYDGNSLGGVLGGAATAISTEWTRAVLGVPGMNFSTLLPRSSDFKTYRAVSDPAYPNRLDQAILIGLTQMLWDRGETNGYAQHLTSHPYEKTPSHTVLIDEAFGDFQVANVTTEVEARTIGAKAHQPVLKKGRSPDKQTFWSIATIPHYPYGGSAIIMWDSGTAAPPSAPVAPTKGKDPHEDPRASRDARNQKSTFLLTNGKVVDVCKGKPCKAKHVG